MTNLQLLLSIGIPSLLVVLSWMSNNSRLAAHDKRFDDMDRRLNEMDRRFNDVISAQHGDALEIMRNVTSPRTRGCY